MAYETIIVEVEDHVATIKLNRPDALNALNLQLLKELREQGHMETINPGDLCHLGGSCWAVPALIAVVVAAVHL